MDSTASVTAFLVDGAPADQSSTSLQMHNNRALTVQKPLRLVIFTLKPPLDNNVPLPWPAFQLDLRFCLLCPLLDV
jgi:hypothetical protein